MSTQVITHPCRFCGQQVYTIQKWGSAKLLTFWAGVLFAPVCFGLVLIFIALCLSNEKYVNCDTCGRQ